MKKLFLLLFILISLSTQAQLPNNFKIEECVISIGTDFEIESIDGYIAEKVISFTTEFTLSINDRKYAKAKQRLISIGTKTDIFDSTDKLIGSVEEVLFTNFGIYSLYNIFDAHGNKIAYSEKHKFMSTEFTIKDMSNKLICTIKRPMINVMSDTWTVNFANTSFDKRLVVFIPCYKTYNDNKSKE